MTTPTKRTTKPKLPPLPVQWVRVRELVAADINPKRHDIDEMAKSIRRHGYVDHGVLDRRTGRLLGGHGRHDALDTMQTAGENPADWPCADPHVHVDDKGDWWVPSSYTTTSDDGEARHLLLALNTLGERAGWDPDGLANLLDQVRLESDLGGTGYDADDVIAMLAGHEDPPLPPTDELDVPARYEVVIECENEAVQLEVIEWIGSVRGDLTARAIVA